MLVVVIGGGGGGAAHRLKLFSGQGEIAIDLRWGQGAGFSVRLRRGPDDSGGGAARARNPLGRSFDGNGSCTSARPTAQGSLDKAKAKHFERLATRRVPRRRHCKLKAKSLRHATQRRHAELLSLGVMTDVYNSVIVAASRLRAW